jgi:hypothetical protein
MTIIEVNGQRFAVVQIDPADASPFPVDALVERVAKALSYAMKSGIGIDTWELATPNHKQQKRDYARAVLAELFKEG